MRDRKSHRTANEILTHAQVSRECKVSKATVHEWYKEGLQAKPSRTEVMHFLAHRKGYAPQSQRERLAEEQADKVALFNAERRGQVILADQVRRVLQSMATDVAARLDSLPGRVAHELATMTEPGEIRARLLHETRAIRSGFAEHVRELAVAGADIADGQRDRVATSGPERKRVGGREPLVPAGHG